MYPDGILVLLLLFMLMGKKVVLVRCIYLYEMPLASVNYVPDSESSGGAGASDAFAPTTSASASVHRAPAHSDA